jgi:alpha-beta hydrolase superfamily lysophospholipase
MAGPDVARLRADYSGPHELVKTSDGKSLFVRRWDAKGESPVSVLILHGITGYSGPYGPMVAEALCSAGHNVFGMDLRGHGLSDGRRGDYPSAERLALDLSETIDLVRGESRKLVVFGHSLGVLSAIIALRHRRSAIDGLVLMSAARRVRTDAYAKPKASATLRAIIGASILRGTPLIEYRRRGMLGTDDPLFDFMYSARFYSALYGAGALEVARMFRSGVLDSPNLRLDGKLGVPLLVGVGDSDELFTVDAAREFCDAVDCDDKEFFVVAGGRHAAFPRGAWAPLMSWLQRKF